MSARDQLLSAAKARIVLKDGPYGTAIQAEKLTEEEFRGGRDFAHDQRGNNDLLNLTQPEVIAKICKSYIDAGATLLATNTFNATAISQADYGASYLVPEINEAAAGILRRCVDEAMACDGVQRWVCGAIGPTNKTLSLSPQVNDPGFREVDFDEMQANYREQCDALITGGVDFLLIETVFDTLNAKAAGLAGREAAEAAGRDVPLMLSFTVTDMSGRNLSGHTIAAFWYSVRHLQPVTIGANCAFGADKLRPYLAELSKVADALVMAYPNAGLPNELGEYDELPEQTARAIGEWVADGLVNIVGGCCGNTPAHIAAMAAAVQDAPPRALPELEKKTRLAGLEPFVMEA